MKVRFGFLRFAGVFEAEIPNDLDPSPELASLIDIEGRSLETAVFTPSGRVPPVNPDLVHRYDTQDEGTIVSVYERVDEPRLFVPQWNLSNGRLLTQVSPTVHGSTCVEKVLNGLSVSQDSQGYIRMTLSGACRPGDIREPTQRDEVNYTNPLESAMPSAVRFIWTGALGHDDGRKWNRTCQTTRTTEVGVTVTCTGLVARRDDIEDTAEQVAATVRRVT